MVTCVIILSAISHLRLYAQVQETVYEWQPLKTMISQSITTKKEKSILGGKLVDVESRNIKSIDKTKKIMAVAIKQNTSGLLFNWFVRFSEKPNGVKEGNYSINTVRLNININGKKYKPKDLKNEDGWAIYKFDKEMYLYNADNEALIENVLVWCDNGMGEKINRVIKAAEKGSVEDMELLSKLYEDGNVSHISTGLSGHINPNPALAEEWKTKANAQRQNGYFSKKGFKKKFKDATVTFVSNGSSIVEYNNGDKFEGVARFGLVFFDGRKFDPSTNRGVGSYEENYDAMRNSVMNQESLNDVEFYIKSGTYTFADGSTQEWKDGSTTNQKNSMNADRERAQKVVIKKAIEEKKARLADLAITCAKTRRQLIAEGYSAAYVNSLFDHNTILTGTPKSMIERAAQLGCNFTIEMKMKDKESGHTQWALAFESQDGREWIQYVTFHSLTNRVIKSSTNIGIK